MLLGILTLVPPLKSGKAGGVERSVPVEFGGLTWMPGHHAYADEDRLALAPEELRSDS